MTRKTITVGIWELRLPQQTEQTTVPRRAGLKEGEKVCYVILEITITWKCCLKGTDWELAFGNSVGIIEKILACVRPELQASYTRNTYNNV